MQNNNSSFGPFRRWLNWILPAIFVLYQNGIQVVPNYKIQYLQSHYLIGDLKIALLSTAYLLPYVLLQIPAGFLVDNFDLRKMLTGAMLIYSVGTFCIMLSDIHNYYPFYISGHLLMGISSSIAFVGSLYLADHWLSAKSFKLAISLTQMSAMVGVLSLVFIFEFLSSHMSWPRLIFANFVFCLLLALTFWLCIRDIKKKPDLQLSHIFTNLNTLFKNQNLWLCCLFVGCTFANISVMTNAWRVDFLESYYHLTRFSATITNGACLVGYAIGAPIFGFLGGRSQKITVLMMFGSLTAFCLLLISHYFIHDITFKPFLYFMIGFFSSCVTLGFALVKQLVPDHMLAMGMSMVNMALITVGLLLVPIVGELLSVTNDNYILSTTPAVVSSLIGFVGAVLLWKRIHRSA